MNKKFVLFVKFVVKKHSDCSQSVAPLAVFCVVRKRKREVSHDVPPFHMKIIYFFLSLKHNKYLPMYHYIYLFSPEVIGVAAVTAISCVPQVTEWLAIVEKVALLLGIHTDTSF